MQELAGTSLRSAFKKGCNQLVIVNEVGLLKKGSVLWLVIVNEVGAA